MKIRSVKVAEKTFKLARSKGVAKDVVFYYQLKSINDHGFLAKNKLVGEFIGMFGGSRSSVYRKIKRLLNLGLINDNYNGYRLVSYDTLFTILGHDMTRKNEKRLGRFKVFKVPVSKIKKLETYVVYEELKLNEEKQKRMISRKKKGVHYIEEYAADVRQYMDSDDIVIDKFFISCRGVASLMGYDDNPSKGHYLEKDMEKEGLISVERVNGHIGFFHGSEREFREKYPDPRIRRAKGSYVYEVLPNSIDFLV